MHNFPMALSYFVRVLPTSFFYQNLIILLLPKPISLFRILIVVRSKVFEKKKTEKKNQSQKAPQQFFLTLSQIFFSQLISRTKKGSLNPEFRKLVSGFEIEFRKNHTKHSIEQSRI